MNEIIELNDVLSARRIKKIMTILTNPSCKYADGRVTSSGLAQLGKHNWQLNLEQKINGIDLYDFFQKQVPTWLINTKTWKDNFTLDLPIEFKSSLVHMYDSKSGPEYDWHYDTSAAKITNGSHPTIQTHACSFILNSNYEGGELEVKKLNGDIVSFKPKTNSCIIFPTTHLHRVKPVTKGIRYSMVVWVNYVVTNTDDWNHYKAFRNFDKKLKEIISFGSAPGKEADRQPTLDRLNELLKDEDKTYEWCLDLARKAMQLECILIRRCMNVK